GPASIRWPKGPARQVTVEQIGSGLKARRAHPRVDAGSGAGDGGDRDVCFLAVGRMLEAAERAAAELEAEGTATTVWDVRVVKPLDPSMIADARRHRLVVTVEDGIRVGGAGSFMADAIASLDPGRQSPPVLLLGTPPEYIPQGKPAAILP